jgi:hypothetical protein
MQKKHLNSKTGLNFYSYKINYHYATKIPRNKTPGNIKLYTFLEERI